MFIKINYRLAKLMGGLIGFVIGAAGVAIAAGVMRWWEALLAVAIIFFLPQLMWLIIGRLSSVELCREDRCLIAYHEAGHAVVAWFTPIWPGVAKVEITPKSLLTGGQTTSLGFTRQIQLQEDLVAAVKVSLGGRAAEKVFLNTASVGAASDLERVGSLCRAMAGKYAMSDELGYRAYGSKPCPATQDRIDLAADRIADDCWLEAVKLIREKAPLVERLAGELMRRDKLTQDDLWKILGPR